MKTPRDGVIHASDLTAEFRFICQSSIDANLSMVETAIGHGLVHDSMLTYDPPHEPETFQGVLGKLTDKTPCNPDAFKAWISAPPYEREVARWPEDEKHAWPGQYRDNAVQVAWEAWQEATKQAVNSPLTP